MAGMMMDAVAATPATAEPEISAKNMWLNTFTWARAPLIQPTSAWQKSISRCEIPEVFMIAAARMKSGIAMSGKLVAPW